MKNCDSFYIKEKENWERWDCKRILLESRIIFQQNLHLSADMFSKHVYTTVTWQFI